MFNLRKPSCLRLSYSISKKKKRETRKLSTNTCENMLSYSGTIITSILIVASVLSRLLILTSSMRKLRLSTSLS